MALASLLAPLFAGDAITMLPSDRLKPPSAEHWFGTDNLGRDVFARTVYGAQISLLVGLLVAGISVVLGLTIGLAAGYNRRLDGPIMRVMDGVMAIPAILLAIALVSLSRASVSIVIAAIVIPEVPRVVRLVRSVVLTVREQPFVEAAISGGSRRIKILLRHILPSTVAPLIVQATYICASAILVESALSFLGAGTPPEIPTWGNMIASSRLYLARGAVDDLLPGHLPRDRGARGQSGRRRAARPARPPAGAADVAMEPILTVDGLKTHFFTEDGITRAVDGVSFTVDPGETLGIVGESGCGKSVTALSILGLLPPRIGRVVDGSVRFEGRELIGLDEAAMRAIRGNRIAMIFQEPMTSLNPVHTIGDQIAEAVQIHQGLGKADAIKRAAEMLRLVRIPDAERRVKDYPHQFSGGMRQRAMIAMALACNPKLLIADEPTTALDVTIQAQILKLMIELQDRSFGAAIMLITHDLGVVAETCQRVIVMYAGRKVEEAGVFELFDRPAHPYTRGLMESIPRAQCAHGAQEAALRNSRHGAESCASRSPAARSRRAAPSRASAAAARRRRSGRSARRTRSRAGKPSG